MDPVRIDRKIGTCSVALPDLVGQVIDVRVVVPRFDQQNSVVSILRKSCCERGTSRARTNDDDIETSVRHFS